MSIPFDRKYFIISFYTYYILKINFINFKLKFPEYCSISKHSKFFNSFLHLDIFLRFSFNLLKLKQTLCWLDMLIVLFNKTSLQINKTVKQIFKIFTYIHIQNFSRQYLKYMVLLSIMIILNILL